MSLLGIYAHQNPLSTNKTFYLNMNNLLNLLKNAVFRAPGAQLNIRAYDNANNISIDNIVKH